MPDSTTITSFARTKRDRIFEQVFYEIKRRISSGTLKPGDRLPPENERARNFNVTRLKELNVHIL
jgi:GntR family transcriptional regulator, transcriptional repressor for pyruvate dehydrogenase complex